MSDQPRPTVRGYTYDGRLSELYRIFIPNLLLTIVTLGIYRFWAITRMRRYLWSRIVFSGERFEYTGTGGELFRGFLLAMLVLAGLGAARGALAWALNRIHPGFGIPVTIAFAVILAMLANAGRFAAQRYRLTRSFWRGIRGGMDGSALRYGLRALGLQLLSGITLFQYTPWMIARLAEHRINASSFGNRSFACETHPRKFYGRFLLALLAQVLLLAVAGFAALVAAVLIRRSDPRVVAITHQGLAIAIGICVVVAVLAILASWLVWTWFRAACLRHVADATTFGLLNFYADLTAGGLLWLRLSNFVIVVFTLGLGAPIATHRSARFLAASLQVGGVFAPEQLAQSTTRSPRTGEGLLDALDGGAIM